MNYESKYKVGEYINTLLENEKYSGLITRVSFTIDTEFYDVLLNWDGKVYKDIHVSYISELPEQKLIQEYHPYNTGGPVVPETYTT